MGGGRYWFARPHGAAGPETEPDLIIEDAEKLSKAGDWTLKVWAGAAYDGDYTVVIEFT